MTAEAARKKARNQRGRARGLRYAYVILALISVGVAFLAFLYGGVQNTKALQDNNHKFCQLLNALQTGQPVPEPADPKTHPAQAKLYQDHLALLDFERSIGCS